MGEFENIKKQIESTGLYSVRNGTFIEAELRAYAEGLDMYFDMLNGLLREMFVSTAENEGLKKYENMLGIFNVDRTVQGRRKSIISALSVTKEDFTENGLRKAFEAFNINGDIQYDDENRTYSFSYTDTLNNEQVGILQNQMAEFVPAWCEFILQESV